MGFAWDSHASFLARPFSRLVSGFSNASPGHRISQAENGIFFGVGLHGLADQLHGGISHIHCVCCPGSRPASLPSKCWCEVCTDSRPGEDVQGVMVVALGIYTEHWMLVKQRLAGIHNYATSPKPLWKLWGHAQAGCHLLQSFKEAIMLRRIHRSKTDLWWTCLLYTSPSPRDRQKSRMPSSA